MVGTGLRQVNSQPMAGSLSRVAASPRSKTPLQYLLLNSATTGVKSSASRSLTEAEQQEPCGTSCGTQGVKGGDGLIQNPYGKPGYKRFRGVQPALRQRINFLSNWLES